jgi:predicted secreted protein
MAIKTVKATINGQTYDLTLNSASGKWEATITAPGKTSYNLAGGYYNVSVEATNEAGTKGSADASTVDGLKLVVKETVAPVITIVSPTSGAYVANSKQPVVFNIVDESGGSGVDISTLVVKQDGTAVAAANITHTAIANGYSVTYTPSAALSDGSHTVTINCKDHDGNAATEKSTTYTVDTVPPTLNVTSPADGLITATSSVTVAGTTNDATSSPVTITISLNGTDQGTVPVGTGGTFSKVVTLKEGSNTIIVKAKDAAGKESSVTRTVTLDTSVPKIKAATITPNPVDTGKTMVISVTIE